jgi:hypothetical protein
MVARGEHSRLFVRSVGDEEENVLYRRLQEVAKLL